MTKNKINFDSLTELRNKNSSWSFEKIIEIKRIHPAWTVNEIIDFALAQEYQFEELIEYVKNGVVKKIVEIIHKNPYLLDYTNDDGFAPLHYAAMFQILNSTNCLIKLGAKTDIEDKMGYTADKIALWYGEAGMLNYTKKCIKIADIIKNKKCMY